MNSTAIKRFAAAVVFLSPLVALAGPFGLEKGDTLQTIGGSPLQLAPGKYKITAVPKPHSAFEYYVLQIGPQSGLCWIKAIGKSINTSVYGTQLRVAYEDLQSRLKENYGSSKSSDFLFSGSIWRDPKDWTMSLVKKERILASTWDRKSNASLPSDIASVAVYVTALRSDTGYVAVEYTFTNEKQCEKEISKKEDAAL